ncbi:MAG: hypothetical protein ABR579_04720 [Actinomycetota bacterium]
MKAVLLSTFVAAVLISAFLLVVHPRRGPQSAGGPAGKSVPRAATPTSSATTHGKGHSELPKLRRPRGALGGYLLIADRGNNRLLLVDEQKHILWRYPTKHPKLPFRFDDDAFFGPTYSSIITNQEDQNTIEILSFPGGRLLWHYGHVDRSGSTRGYLHTPDDAYLLPNGRRSVADVGNCRVLFISRHKRIVRQIGTTGACGHDPPRMLASPNGDTPYSKGRMLITEIGGSWIDAVGKDGNLLWSVRAPLTYPSDAQWLGHGKILLADYATPGRVMIMKKSGKVVWSYGPPSGRGALDHPSLALDLPNGNIAVNDDYHHRVVVIDPRKKKIVWQYGHFDRPGTSHGDLNTPDGMDYLPYRIARNDPAIRKLITRAEQH